MKIDNLTVYKCDACGKEESLPRYEEAPLAWFSSQYRTDTVRLEYKDITAFVSFKETHFCSSKCVCDYFAIKFLESVADEVEKLKNRCEPCDHEGTDQCAKCSAFEDKTEAAA